MKLLYSYMRRLCAYITDRLYQFKRFLQLSIDGLGLSCPVFTKVTGILPVALVCFQFVCLAQESPVNREATEMIEEIKPLEVGQKVPDEFWRDSIVVYQDGEITETTLESYKGKPLLLDFWNTWCTTCIAHIPDLYQTETYNKGVMNVLLVTNEDPTEVQTFFANKEIAKKYPLTSIVGNKTAPKYFAHGSVPFYVLLNSEGMVQTMTGLADLRMEDIERLVTVADAFRISDVTTDTKNFPAFLARKYAAVPNFYYSYFFRGENSDLGGGNIRRKKNDRIYSLSMLNITIREMFGSVARYRYEELGIPFHHSFVQFQTDLPVLAELSSLEYSVPVADKNSVPLETVEMLNLHTGLDARFQQQQKTVRIIFDKNKPINFSKITSSALKSTALSAAVRRSFEDAIPVFDVTLLTNVVLPQLPTGSSVTIRELEDMGLGVEYIEVEFPILIIEEK